MSTRPNEETCESHRCLHKPPQGCSNKRAMKVSTEDTPVPIHFPRLQKEHSIVTIVGVEENDEPAPTGKRIYATPPQGGKALGPRESSTSTILGTQELQALVHSSQGGPTGEQFVETHDSNSSLSGSDPDSPKRGRSIWTKDHDAALVAFVKKHGLAQWAKAGRALGRTAKECRNRWFEKLERGPNDLEWTNEEERRLVQFHRQFGSKWTTCSRYMPGRSPDAIKRHWNNTIECEELRNSQRERPHVLRDYILSLGGVAEDGHVASPAPPLARTGNLSSMGSSKMDPVRPPAEALKSPLSGQFSSLVQNLPTRINSETLSPGLEQLPQFTGDCGSVWRTVGLTPAEKLKTGHFTPEKETVGGATRAAGEVRQGSPLNWINQWAASHPSQHAESSGPVHFGAVPVSVPVPVEGSAGGTGVPMSDRVLHGMETEWVRLLAAVNGNETNPGASRTGALEALLPDANPKPLTSQAATEGNAVPSNVMSHQVPAAAGGFRQAERSPPRKRSVSDRAAMEDLLGLGRFSVTPAPHAVTSQYPVLSSGVSGMTSEVVQSGDPSLFLTDQRFPSPLSARGAWGTSPTASLPNQAGFTKPGANPHATGETDGFLRAPKQRRIAEDESSYAARATGLQKPGSLDSVKPAVSNENKVLVSLVTNHLRSLLDEQAAQLKVVGEGPGGQVVRLREQHVQIRSALSFLSTLASIPDPSSPESNPLSSGRVGSFRGSEDRETKPTFVNRPVVRKPEMNQSAFAPSPTALPPPMLPSCHAPVTPTGHTSVSLTTHPPVAPTGHSTVNLTDPRLRFARPEGSPGVLSRVPSEDQWLLAQLATFLPKESSPVEHRLPGLSQGLEIPAISETPLEDAPLTPDAEWERRLGHCTFDWPTESAKKAEGFPSVRPGTFTEALLDVPSADDTCRFLGGAEYGLPGLGSYHNQVPGLGNLCI